MENYNKQEKIKGKIEFIPMSIIGIILFLIPVLIVQDGERQTTLLAIFLANWLKDLSGSAMSTLIITIIMLSAILTILFLTILKNKVKPDDLIANAFQAGPAWMILRILAVVFVRMTYFKIGSKVIYSENMGGLVFNDLLPTLIAVFLFTALFLPLLMEHGLLELSGPSLRPIMRPLFTLPGRSAADNLASFIEDGTVGVLITSCQYEKGIYSKRESIVISTTFSVVSITFAIVIAQTIGL